MQSSTQSFGEFDISHEIQRLRREYNDPAQLANPSPRLQLEFAGLLACSTRRLDVEEAIELMEELLEIGYHRADCLYQVAMAQLKMADYYRAKQSVDRLLRLDPKNLSALSLQSLILDRLTYDGLVGSSILLFTTLAGVVGVVFAKKWFSRCLAPS